MSSGVGLGCFVVKPGRRIFAVGHMDREKVCILVCCDLNKRIRSVRVPAGFNAVIHQVKKDAAEITVFKLYVLRKEKLKRSPDMIL